MNDVGLTLLWSALQVSLVLIPAVALHVIASRRSPASGAWVASLSLGLVVAFSFLMLIPRRGAPERGAAQSAPSKSIATRAPGAAVVAESRSGEGRGWPIARLRGAWERFEKTAAAPAVRFRAWGSLLAVFAIAGSGVGLLHLVVGVWGVHLCRRKSRPVEVSELNDLIKELMDGLGCRRRVEVREAPGLTSPATAGWWRSVVFLPDDWRSWDDQERRAVFAHELAHVCRNDYVTGLVARVALALYFYHPLVHWLAARLALEQELAADAIGARFAGGRTLYLQSLSRLALRQDGRSPCWPARAFLPAKGTLIRRIAMLREETASEKPWSGLRRAFAALVLLTVATGASLLHGPARGDDKEKKAVNPEYGLGELSGTAVEKRLEPFDLSYFPDNPQGIVAFRPAAAFRRAGMEAYGAELKLVIGEQWSTAAKFFGFDPTRPGLQPLRLEMFEQVVGHLSLTRSGPKKGQGRVMFGDVVTARTTEPVDWLALLRAFKRDPVEVRDGDRVYYKLKDPLLGPEECGLYFPDDRTVVFAAEKQLLPLIRRETKAPSLAFANGKDWDRLLHGLAVVALDNRDGQLKKAFTTDDPDDDDVTALFDHSELWTFGLGQSDEIDFTAVAKCLDAAASQSTARATETLLAAVRKGLADAGPSKTPPSKGEQEIHQLADRLAVAFLKNARVDRDGRSVILRSAGIGTILELAKLYAANGF